MGADNAQAASSPAAPAEPPQDKRDDKADETWTVYVDAGGERKRVTTARYLAMIRKGEA